YASRSSCLTLARSESSRAWCFSTCVQSTPSLTELLRFAKQASVNILTRTSINYAKGRAGRSSGGDLRRAPSRINQLLKGASETRRERRCGEGSTEQAAVLQRR